MRLRYTETAAAELDEILNYVSEQNPLAAQALASRIERSTEVLSNFPELAQATDEPGIRRLVIGRYPYVIFYTIERDAIVVLHVRHTARLAPWHEP